VAIPDASWWYERLTHHVQSMNIFVRRRQAPPTPKYWPINSKLMSGNLTREGSPADSRASVKSKGLCSRFLLRHFIVILIFRGGLFGAVQLQDRSDPNFPDALLASPSSCSSYSRLRSSPSTWICAPW